MTDIATLSAPSMDLIGPGRLVLVVGPSGAGKDTLIGLAQAACAGDIKVVFPQRVVTREASSFENNEAVSPMQFGQMLAHGDFAFQWEAHGLRYGVPRSIVDDIRAGHAVVVNASRTIVEFARRSYANVTVVSVTAPPEVLAQRLAARARSSDGQLDERLRRAVIAAVPDVVIENIGRAEDHAAELLQVIRRH
ncbi:phosphonate metabolism protein/1,5-bisphosphokinase (PRPP-forming) PhnN [Afipia broomeae]|uniref:Ribose 1,5-bisphosphate phosphokinase PhnN n=1 Tax=Afipia broomeae ATCC 49717 TaxID=883078 RepID=K8PIW6_9BRAD|nr:phosphonate metabolism protein/1,5-bisphosphokinase (PRPP-forming) PhnN [Afipia broomeae]EKS39480.1 phosphonate metabolism protein/1,5-bisphosphokinase (PRPP-forming) PhnN [Afipia broomeae ATCC 49717]